MHICDHLEGNMLKELDSNTPGGASSRFLVSPATLVALGSLLFTGTLGGIAFGQAVSSGTAPLPAATMAVHLKGKRQVATPAANIEAAVTSAGVSSTFNSDQGPGPGP